MDSIIWLFKLIPMDCESERALGLHGRTYITSNGNTPPTARHGNPAPSPNKIKKLLRPMKRPPKKYYIKRRDNGQTKPYYSRLGQLSKAAAKRAQSALAGSNEIIGFDTMEDYSAEIARLKAAGETVY